MRLRNAERGTVVSVGDESAKRLQAAGWESADSSTSTRSTSSTQDDKETAKPKRRTRRSE